MAENVERLLLQVDASVSLLRTELQRGEQSLTSLENRTVQTERRMASSFQRIDRAAGNSRMGFQQLGFQLQDVAAQAATGTSALTIFAQQGGQVAFALSQFGGTAGRIGAFLSGPWGVALTAAAVGLGVLAKASSDAGDEGLTLGEKYGEAGREIEEASGRIARAVSGVLDGLSEIIKQEREDIVREVGFIAKAFNFLAEQQRSRLAPLTPVAEGPRPQRAPEDILRDVNPSVALFGEQVFRNATARPERTRTARTRTGSTRTAAPTFDAADARASSFQEVAQRLTRDATSPLKSVEADLRALQPGIERIIDGATAGFRRLEGLSDQVAQNLGFAIANGQGLGTALVNSFRAVAAELIASGLFAALRALAGGSNLSSAFQAGVAAFGGARANGGPVVSGRTYLVGERGPELFTPRSAGAIIPNNALGGGASEIIVRTEPSPLFVTTVAQVSAQGGASAAGQVIRRARRGNLMGSMGA